MTLTFKQALRATREMPLGALARAFLKISFLAAATSVSATSLSVLNTAYATHAGAPGALPSNAVAVAIASAAIEVFPGTPATSSTPTGIALLGTDVTVRVTASACPTTPGMVDTLPVTVTLANGDQESLTAVETGPDTGVFQIAGLPLARSTPTVGNAVLESVSRTQATFSVSGCSVPVSAQLEIFDPAGRVLDSQSLAGVAGAQVSLVTAVAGQCTSSLASVQTVSSATGALVAAPNPVTTDALGQFELPLVAAGSYCYAVAPPSGYAFPSTVPASSFPSSVAVVAGASYGAPFSLSDAWNTPAMDVPVDAQAGNNELLISKETEDKAAVPGTVLPYTVRIKNTGATPTAALTYTDAYSAGLVYVEGSLRLNGLSVQPDVSPGKFSLPLTPLGAQQQHVLSYRMTVTASAGAAVVNRAFVSDGRVTRDSGVKTPVVRPMESASKGVLTIHAYAMCDGQQVPVAGLRFVAQDGVWLTTDAQGRASRYGMPSGTYAVRLDPRSVPAPSTVLQPQAMADNRPALVDIRFGELIRLPVALSCSPSLAKEAAPAARTEAFDAIASRFTTASQSLAESATRTPAALVESAGEPGLVPAPVGDNVLEAQLLTIVDNKPEFLFPTNKQVLTTQVTTVRAKGPAGAVPTLMLNGAPVSASRLGQTSVYADKNAAGWEFVGVPLQAGANTLELLLRDQFGNLRGSSRVALRAPGEFSALSAHPLTAPTAGEGEVVRVEVSATDAAGLALAARLPLTVEADSLKLLTPDVDPSQPGTQLFLEGPVVVNVASPLHAGKHVLKLTSGSVQQSIELDFVPAMQPLLVTGVAEGVVRVRSGQALQFMPTTSLDAFTQELRSISGSFGNADVAGRLAVYLKGKIRGDRLLTLAYDTDARTRDSLFQSISPEEYYPVYGDLGGRSFDAQAASRLYVRIEKGQSWTLWGDFSTRGAARLGLPEATLSAYSRSVTGLAEHQESEFTVMDGFILQDTSKQVVKELRATGISGPFDMGMSDLLSGSEVVELVVRDLVSPQQVVSRKLLRPFNDYQFDAMSGRLMLAAPAPAYIDGNPVYLRMSAERMGQGDTHYTVGAQVAHRVNAEVALSAKVVHEARNLDPWTLVGTQVRYGTAAHGVGLEVAATQSAGEAATDGFAAKVSIQQSVSGGSTLDASATVVSDGFDNASAGVQPGHFDAHAKWTRPLLDGSKAQASVRTGRKLDGSQAQHAVAASIETTVAPGVTLEYGARHLQEQSENAPAKEALTATAKVAGQVPSLKELSGYASVEQGTEVGALTLGMAYQLTPATRLTARYEVYNTLPVFSGGTGIGQGSAVGVESAYSSTGKAFAELRSPREGASMAAGLKESWTIAPGWTVMAGAEQVQGLDIGVSSSTAVTTELVVATAEDWRARVRWERTLGSAPTSLLSASFAVKVRPGLTALARQSYTKTATAAYAATRTQLGAAWREDAQDGLLVLEHRVDPVSTGARDSDVLSGHYSKTLERGLTLSARAGARVSTLNADGLESSSHGWLMGLRVTKQVAARWQVGASLEVAGSTGQQTTGYGLELGYEVKPGVRVSAGYNWAAAVDPVLAGHTSSTGIYLRVRATIDESLFQGLTQADAK